jgi:hypothetical protein
MAAEGFPGKALVTMDLPKAAHALVFDRHSMMRVARDRDGTRIAFTGDGRAVEMVVDDRTLAALLRLVAESIENAELSEPGEPASLREASDRLASALCRGDR